MATAKTKPTKKPPAKKPAAKPAVKAATKPVAAPASTSGADALFEQCWQKSGDLELLHVYADALEQAGDPRGKFIQLSLAGEAQKEARATMERNLKGKLVGPAAKFLREWEFSPTTGLVDKARTELPNLLTGLDAIGRIHPRFILTLTSIKTLKDADALGAVSPAKLARIWFIDFGMLTGSFGGVQLSDKQLAAMAPAFAELECLQLSCRGTPGKCFSPAGLRVFGTHAKRLRYLAIDFYQGELPPASEYAKVIADAGVFPALRALEFAEVTAADVAARKGLRLNPIGTDLNFSARDGLAARLEPLLA